MKDCFRVCSLCLTAFAKIMKARLWIVLWKVLLSTIILVFQRRLLIPLSLSTNLSTFMHLSHLLRMLTFSSAVLFAGLSPERAYLSHKFWFRSYRWQ